MKHVFGRALVGALAAGAVALSSGAARGETFEVLSYAPPRGWTVQDGPQGRVYGRQDGAGIGVITFMASRPATGSAPEEFASTWRAHVAQFVPGPAPQPKLQREGDYTAAVGVAQALSQGTRVTLMLITFVGRGRAIGVLGMASGGDVLREVTAFLDTLDIAPGAPEVATPAPSGPGAAGQLEVEFDVPPGYVARREGGAVVLAPKTPGEATPCAYGLSPPRPSRGRLDADAQAALPAALPGWERKGDAYNAMRGTAPAGWPYYWIRADLQRLAGGTYEYVTAMAMVFPAGAGRVNVVWGFGNPARCLLDDVSFARLFHSLRPRGWSSDGGKALIRDLEGTWRNSERSGMQQYRFVAGGRYEYGIGTITQLGFFERTSSSVADGRYEVRGNEIVLTPDRKDRKASRHLVRVYDEYALGRWTRAMSLLDERGDEVQYHRIETGSR